LRAFILHLDGATVEGIDLGQRGFAVHTQTDGRERCGLGLDAGFFQFLAQIGALVVEGVDAQIERSGLLHALGQSPELITDLRLERLDQPLGQVVAVRLHQLFGLDAVAGSQPFEFLGRQRGLDEGLAVLAFLVLDLAFLLGLLAQDGGKAEDGQTALACAAARMRQAFKQQLFAQHGVSGFSQGGAFARAEVTVFAEEIGHHGIGRVFKCQGALDEFRASVEKLLGCMGAIVPLPAYPYDALWLPTASL
jgi:hypothetical protein